VRPVDIISDLHWLAPAHLPVEVLSVVRGRVLGGKLSQVRAGAVAAMGNLSMDLVDPCPTPTESGLCETPSLPTTRRTSPLPSRRAVSS